jgi:hypothetical protein
MSRGHVFVFDFSPEMMIIVTSVAGS